MRAYPNFGQYLRSCNVTVAFTSTIPWHESQRVTLREGNHAIALTRSASLIIHRRGAPRPRRRRPGPVHVAAATGRSPRRGELPPESGRQGDSGKFIAGVLPCGTACSFWTARFGPSTAKATGSLPEPRPNPFGLRLGEAQETLGTAWQACWPPRATAESPSRLSRLPKNGVRPPGALGGVSEKPRPRGDLSHGRIRRTARRGRPRTTCSLL